MLSTPLIAYIRQESGKSFYFSENKKSALILNGQGAYYSHLAI